MMIQLKLESIRKPLLMTASCLAIILVHAAGSPAIAQDTNTLSQEVQAVLRQPLPTPPDGVTLPPTRSDEAVAQELRAMLFGNEAAGQVTPLAAGASQPSAAAASGAGTTQSAASQVSGQAAAGNPLAGQIPVELPPAPPEKYAPSAAQTRPAVLPNAATIPPPPPPPESQAPSMLPRPPVSQPAPATPSQPPARLPDPTVIPLPPHPPEDQAPWRQGV